MTPLQLQHHQLDLDSPAPGTPVHSRYYKSSKQDKISDYEDIWAASPAPVSPTWAVSPTPAPAISPTASELRFKQFIFSQFTTGQPEEEEEVAGCPSSDPSYPSCSSTEPPGTSEEEGEADSSSLASFASSSQPPSCIHTSDLSDPLAALEVLSDCDTDHDLDDDDDDIIYSDIESSDNNLAHCDGNDVEDPPAGVEAGEASEGGSVAEERSSKAPCSGSLSGLLRKLSIRSRASVTKEKPPSCDKRLSAVIGCYLPPSLLGLSSEDCQVREIVDS